GLTCKALLSRAVSDASQKRRARRFAEASGATLRRSVANPVRPPPMLITVETTIRETARVAQVRGLFDLPAEKTSRLQWRVELPLAERPWHVGLVCGPSGCGKSTIARRLWP